MDYSDVCDTVITDEMYKCNLLHQYAHLNLDPTLSIEQLEWIIDNIDWFLKSCYNKKNVSNAYKLILQ